MIIKCIIKCITLFTPVCHVSTHSVRVCACHASYKSLRVSRVHVLYVWMYYSVKWMYYCIVDIVQWMYYCIVHIVWSIVDVLLFSTHYSVHVCACHACWTCVTRATKVCVSCLCMQMLFLKSSNISLQLSCEPFLQGRGIFRGNYGPFLQGRGIFRGNYGLFL